MSGWFLICKYLPCKCEFFISQCDNQTSWAAFRRLWRTRMHRFPSAGKWTLLSSVHTHCSPPRPLPLQTRTPGCRQTRCDNQNKQTLERRVTQDDDESILPYHTWEIKQPLTRSDWIKCFYKHRDADFHSIQQGRDTRVLGIQQQQTRELKWKTSS